ncbi:MAG: glycosyltransferase family 39 protein [Bacteroidota bacterium]|jgi:hypothetical protein
MIKEVKTKHLFIVLIVVSFLYNYQYVLKYGPRSTHQWRQADALSISLNYYNEGMKFFEPKIHAQYSTDGKGVGEFPIVYYINAMVWKAVGINYFTPRLLILLLSFIGLFFLFKSGQLLLNDGFWSLILPLLFLTSPVYIYYANNFIVNIPALSFLFGAWYYLLKFRENFKQKYLIFSSIFFTVSFLLRSTMAIGYLPVIFIFCLEFLGLLKPLISRKKLLDIFVLLLPLALVVPWYLFAKSYNNANNSVYFLTTIRPIWIGENLGDIWVKFYNNLLPNFHFAFIGGLIILAFLFLIVSAKKLPKQFNILLILIVLEIISYFLLWYVQFDVHDYYTLDFFIFFPPVVLGFLAYHKNHNSFMLQSNKLKIVVSLTTVFFLLGCATKSRAKYNSKDFIFNKRLILTKDENDYWNWYHWYYNERGLAIETVKPYLRKIGIKKEDLVISFPDQSPNISLFFMDQKGFTNLYYYDKSLGEKTAIYKLKGAKYLILSEPDLMQDSTLAPYLKNQIGEYKNIKIFELKN